VISTIIENVASVIAIPDQTALDSELDGRRLRWGKPVIPMSFSTLWP